MSMSEKPVAWIVKLPKKRRGFTNDVCMYYKDGEMLQGHRDAGDEIIPLYAESPAQARALAIAECAKAILDDESGRDSNGYFADLLMNLASSFIGSEEPPEIFPGTMDALDSLGARK